MITLPGGIIVGLSTESKPTNIPYDAGRPTIFRERDTRREYILGNNLRWILKNQTPLNLAGETDLPVSTQIHEFGDGFPTIPAKSVIPMDSTFVESTNTKTKDVSSDQKYTFNVSNPLITSKDAPFEGHQVFDTNLGSRQLASDSPTTSYFGTDGFFAGIWFRCFGAYRDQTLFCIGDTTGAVVKLYFAGDNDLNGIISDGTNQYNVSIPAYRFLDGQWHYAALHYDKTDTASKSLRLTIGNSFVGQDEKSVSVSTLNTLDNSSGKVVIGKSFDGTNYAGGMWGELTNFQSYLFPNEPDVNSMKIFYAGIRESPLKGYTVATHSLFTAQYVFGNLIRILATNSDVTKDHVIFMFTCDEGNYNFDFVHHKNTTYRDFKLYIDNVFYATFESNSSTADNIQSTLDGIHLGKGHHFIKLVAQPKTSDNASDFPVEIRIAAIILNKTDGTTHHTFEGSSSFKFFGLESRRRNGNFGTALSSTSVDWGTLFTQSAGYNPIIGDYIEFDVYAQRGLYLMSLDFLGGASYGIIKTYIDAGDISTDEIMTVDCYNATSQIFNESAQVYLEGGHHTIRVLVSGKNASSTGHKLGFNAISAVLIALSANDRKTTIYAVDEDIDNINDSYQINRSPTGSSRFGFFGSFFYTNKSILVRRYFSGGDYYMTLALSGASSFTAKIDGTAIPLQSTRSTIINKGRRSFVSIPRGYHEITITTPSSGSVASLIFMEFDLVQPRRLTDDKPAEENESSGLIPIGRVQCNKDETTKAIKLGNVNMNRFDKIIAESDAIISGGLGGNLCIILNDKNAAANYTHQGQYMTPQSGVRTAFNHNASAIHYILSAVIGTNTTSVIHAQCHIEQNKIIDQSKLFGTCNAATENTGESESAWKFNPTDDMSTIKKIAFCTTVSSMKMKVGTVLEIFARKRI